MSNSADLSRFDLWIANVTEAIIDHVTKAGGWLPAGTRFEIGHPPWRITLQWEANDRIDLRVEHDSDGHVTARVNRDHFSDAVTKIMGDLPDNGPFLHVI